MKNDERILKLKDQIKLKRSEVNKITKFTPITNCSLELDGTRLNIHCVSKSEAIDALVKLNCYYNSAVALDLVNDYKIGGFAPKDWMKDLKWRLDYLKNQEQQNELKEMESLLNNLLSKEKQTELEIDKIEKMLKG